jgi:hypothetical protein
VSGIFSFLYQRFAFAAFMSGIVGGVGSSLISSSAASPNEIVAGILYVVVAAQLAWLHAIFADMDAKASSASAVSGGVIDAAILIDEQLSARRHQVLGFVAGAVICFVAALAVARCAVLLM